MIFRSQNAQLDIMISDENGKYVVNCGELWWNVANSFQGLEIQFYLGVNIVVTDPSLSQVHNLTYFITSA